MHQSAVLASTPPPATADGAVSAPAPQDIDLRLDWIGTLGASSCPLEAVWRDPSLTQGIAGVYLIWSERAGRSILYVGNSRDIGAMLRTQHDDPRIAAPASIDDLRVSWAAVASVHRPGVTQFLIATLAPAIVESAPVARAISVNLPI